MIRNWIRSPISGCTQISEQGELALLDMFVFLYIMAHGGGLWSVDTYIQAPDTSGSSA